MGELKFHVAVIGAGLGGLAAAIGIARAGYKVTILEQAPVLGEVGHDLIMNSVDADSRALDWRRHTNSSQFFAYPQTLRPP